MFDGTHRDKRRLQRRLQRQVMRAYGLKPGDLGLSPGTPPLPVRLWHRINRPQRGAHRMTRAEFLRARLAEDEYAANAAISSPAVAAGWREMTSGCLDIGDPAAGAAGWDYVWAVGDSRVTRFVERNDPERVLADVAAKRAVADGCAMFADEPAGDGHMRGSFSARAAFAQTVLDAMCAPYRDHPDYGRWERR